MPPAGFALRPLRSTHFFHLSQPRSPQPIREGLVEFELHAHGVSACLAQFVYSVAVDNSISVVVADEYVNGALLFYRLCGPLSLPRCEIRRCLRLPFELFSREKTIGVTEKD